MWAAICSWCFDASFDPGSYLGGESSVRYSAEHCPTCEAKHRPYLPALHCLQIVSRCRSVSAVAYWPREQLLLDVHSGALPMELNVPAIASKSRHVGNVLRSKIAYQKNRKHKRGCVSPSLG